MEINFQEKDPITNLEAAALLVEVIPLLMNAIRREMRSSRGGDLSVPQFRTLVYIQDHPGAALSDAAEFVGLGLPSMSKMVDSLCERGLIDRSDSRVDRRRVTMALTPQGVGLMQQARACTVEHLAERLDGFPGADLDALQRELTVLRQAFNDPR
jgi:DNA-binding MarR family transcriptional regulator